MNALTPFGRFICRPPDFFATFPPWLKNTGGLGSSDGSSGCAVDSYGEADRLPATYRPATDFADARL